MMMGHIYCHSVRLVAIFCSAAAGQQHCYTTMYKFQELRLVVMGFAAPCGHARSMYASSKTLMHHPYIY